VVDMSVFRPIRAETLMTKICYIYVYTYIYAYMYTYIQIGSYRRGTAIVDMSVLRPMRAKTLTK